MASLAELITKIVTLSSRVDSVSGKLDTVARKLEEMNERLIRLEGSSDLIAEKAKTAAMSAVVQTNQHLVEKIARIEVAVQHTDQRIASIANHSTGG